MLFTILGATGNVGNKIAENLIEKENVRLYSRSAKKLIPSLVNKALEKSDLAGLAYAFPGDIRDTDFLTQAFRGVDAVFTLIPPDMRADKYIPYASQISESIAHALEASGVKYVVNLSSIGAEHASGTGLIAGLHNHEERLNRIKGLNVLHLRAGFFMENLLGNIDQIKSSDTMSGPMRGDLKIPFIATQDIADVAAEHLVKRDFTGVAVKTLLGQRDLTLTEVASIIGKKIGKADLSHVMTSYDAAEKKFMATGFSPDVSRLYIEMVKALNEGYLTGSLKRTAENTTRLSFEEFCDRVFVPLYTARKAA